MKKMPRVTVTPWKIHGNVLRVIEPIYIADHNAIFSSRTGITTLEIGEMLTTLRAEHRNRTRWTTRERIDENFCELELLTIDGYRVIFSCYSGDFSFYFQTLCQ